MSKAAISKAANSMIRLSLNRQIALGTVIGVAVGLWLQTLPADDGSKQTLLTGAELISGVFIDLLKMILAPLVFTSITVGVANLRAQQDMHRIWLSTLIYFGATSLIAIGEGLFTANVFAPGSGLDSALFQEAKQQGGGVASISPYEFINSVLHALFINPVSALAQGNILAIVCFALFLGIALVVGGERYRNMRLLLQESLEILLRMIGWIMHVAPLGIMALLIKLFATQEHGLLLTLVKFVAVIIGTTLLHGVVVLPLLLYLFTGMKPWRFWGGAQKALITAFATSSSSATLPVSLHCAEQHLHIKPDIAGFVLPLGATMNMDGSALYEAGAALFVAQLMGIELNGVQQLIVCLTAMLGSIGAPGIPSAGMVTMVMVLQAVGLPAEAIAILLPMDKLLDTIRTVVNVEGDMIGGLIVQSQLRRRRGH
jgi:Na+/H+-dicarboxylate symporter